METFILFLIMYMHAFVCGGQKRASDHLELERQMVVKLPDVGVGI